MTSPAVDVFTRGGWNMSKKILQINVRFNVSAAELEEEFKQNQATGIYLFEDDDSLISYIEGPIVAAMKEKKAFSDINVKYFDIVEKATAVTRGPV
jgi:hypothetical protein